MDNPYTNTTMTPVWGLAATGAGRVGYRPWHDDADQLPDGYNVNGIGAASGVTIFLIRDPERRWEPPLTSAPTGGSGPQ
jgi:hypothetical protein